jgi:hypothetical protein
MAAAKKEKSVAWLLFHHRWHVSIPEMYLYDKAYLEEVGIPSSGDRAIDRQMAHNRREMRLTAAALALFLDEGAPIRLINPKDAIPLYRLIVEHLNNWKMVISTQFNYGKPPIEDLRKFDALAAAVFPVASQFPEFKPQESNVMERLNRALSKRSPVALNAPIKKEPPIRKPFLTNNKKEEPTPTPVPVGHTPIADAIARQLFKRG